MERESVSSESCEATGAALQRSRHGFWWLFNEMYSSYIWFVLWQTATLLTWNFFFYIDKHHMCDSWHQSNGIREKHLTAFFRNKVPRAKQEGTLYLHPSIHHLYIFYVRRLILCRVAGTLYLCDVNMTLPRPDVDTQIHADEAVLHEFRQSLLSWKSLTTWHGLALFMTV